MKTRIYNVYKAAAGTLLLTAALAACTDSREPMTENETPREAIFFSVTATQGEGAETRVTHEPNDNQGMDVKWATGDKIYVGKFPTDAYGAISNYLSLLTITHGMGQTTALFEGGVASEHLPENGETLYAIYGKADKIKFYDSSIRYDYTGQRQTANNDRTHLADYDFMTATAIYNDTPGANHSFSFNHVGSMMKFTISGLGNLTVKKLTLSTYDGSEVFPDSYSSGASISLDLGTGNSSGITIESGGTLEAYLMVPKTTATAGKNLVLYATTTDDKNYATLLKGAQIEAQKFYTVEATLAEYTFKGGGTTEEDPYQIENAGDLTRLAVMTNSGMMSTQNKYFKLTTDIDMATGAEAWVPIGNSIVDTYSFKGTFLGNKEGENYSISNLPSKTTYGNAGLFGDLSSGATIKNVTVNGQITINGAEKRICAGGIAGQAGYSIIENCLSNCTITISANGEGTAAGGIFGKADGDNVVINCTNTGAISSNNHSGGIMGSANCETITNCTNKAEITSSNAEYPAGGIVGYLWLQATNKQFTLTGYTHTGSKPELGPGYIIGKYSFNQKTSSSGAISTITIKKDASDKGETFSASTEAVVTGKWPDGQNAELPPFTPDNGWNQSATGN